MKLFHVQPFQGWETWHVCQLVLLATASITHGYSCSALPWLQKLGDPVRRFRSLPLTPPTVTHIQPFQGWQRYILALSGSGVGAIVLDSPKSLASCERNVKEEPHMQGRSSSIARNHLPRASGVCKRNPACRGDRPRSPAIIGIVRTERERGTHDSKFTASE